MDRIIVNNETYYGNLIHKGSICDIEVSIYVLNFISEKYLVLQKEQHNGEVKSFIATGIEKVYSMMELLNNGVEIEEIKRDVDQKLKEFKDQCYIRNLRRVNESKLRDLIYNYYRNNYHIFTILGLRVNDLMRATV